MSRETDALHAYIIRLIGITFGISFKSHWGEGERKTNMPLHSQESHPHMSNHETARAVIPRLNLQNRLRGLLVDSDRTCLHVNSTILTCFGVETQAVSNGAEALELFNSEDANFDIVLVELFMPVMNGREIAKQIRMKGSDCLILGISTEKIAREILLFTVVGDEFMEKPLDCKRLAEILTSLDSLKSDP